MTPGTNIIDLNDARPQGHYARQQIANADYPRDLKARLAPHAQQLCEHLLPHGKRRGPKFYIGSFDGAPGDSTEIELAAGREGLGHDFATGEGSGDLIGLWQRVRRCRDFAETCQQLEQWLGNPFKPPVRQQGPSMSDELGAPTGTWHYTDEAGKILATVRRYDLADGSKQFRPWDAVAAKAAMPALRPLYNRPGIAAATHVVLVEGEKCADALIAQGIPATTAMGGAKAPIDKTDWTPLAGKHVIVWPDADRPGTEYAAAVSAHLRTIAASVAIAQPPQGVAEGWDAADAIAEGFDIRAHLGAAAAPKPSGLQISDWSAQRYDGDAPAIEWLCEGTIPMGVPCVVASVGGIGKSFLMLDFGLRVAVGKSYDDGPIFGGPVSQQGTVVILSAEDSAASVHRRLERIDPNRTRYRARDKLIVVPLPDAGGPMPLVAENGRRLDVTEGFLRLCDQLERIRDLRLVVIDPLQAFILADANDPSSVQFMWTALASICSRTGATLMVSHHMRKDGAGSIGTADEAREAIRGSTGIVDGARLAYALWKEGEDDTRRICDQLGVDFSPAKVVNGAVVKANDQANLSIQRYLRTPSGLLVDRTSDIENVKGKPRLTKTIAIEILCEVNEKFRAKTPYKLFSTPHGISVVDLLQRRIGDKKEAIETAKAWQQNGIVELVIVNSNTKEKGALAHPEKLS